MYTHLTWTQQQTVSECYLFIPFTISSDFTNPQWNINITQQNIAWNKTSEPGSKRCASQQGMRLMDYNYQAQLDIRSILSTAPRLHYGLLKED